MFTEAPSAVPRSLAKHRGRQRAAKAFCNKGLPNQQSFLYSSNHSQQAPAEAAQKDTL